MGWFEEARKRRQEYWRDWNAKCEAEFEAEKRKKEEDKQIHQMLHDHIIRPDEIDGPDYEWDQVNRFLVAHGYHPNDTSYCTVEMDIINQERMDLCREQDDILKEIGEIQQNRIAAKKELNYCIDAKVEIDKTIAGIAKKRKRDTHKRASVLNAIHNGVGEV